jgi:Domain of unknown function (DUF3850)
MNPNDVFETTKRRCPVTATYCPDCSDGDCKRITRKPRREYTRIEAISASPAGEVVDYDPPAYERTAIAPEKSDPVEHDLKIWPAQFEAICSGAKRHEVRRFDRAFRVGDILRLREYDPARAEYTGTEARVKVSWITAPGTFGLPPDLGVLSIEKAYARVRKSSPEFSA